MLDGALESIRRSWNRYFPPACAGCEGVVPDGGAFCTVCRPAAPRLHPPACARCAVPMETFAPRGDAPSECSRCRRTDPAFDRVMAFWEYDDAVADAIRRIKYGGDLPALRALCRQAEDWFWDRLEEFPANTPVVALPAHPEELRERGFHVPTLALRRFGVSSRNGAGPPRLEKVRATRRQAGLGYAERRKNVRGVFRTARTDAGTGTVVLFDDVVTTGATADAAATALKRGGFQRVVVLVFARAARAGDPQSQHRSSR